MADEVAEEVVVQTSDIVVIRDALNTAWHRAVSLDYAEAYRTLNTGPIYSAHTSQLEEALQKAQAITELAEGSDDEPDNAESDNDDEAEIPSP
jgi:hypothetical protein